MKNIALIGNAPETLIRFRSDLIKELVSGGHRVFAFAPAYTRDQKKLVRAIGAVPVKYRISRTGLNPLQDLKLVRQYAILFRKHQITVVFSYFVKPVIYGSIAARIVGITEIYTMLCGLGYLFTDDPYETSYKRRVLRTLISPLFIYAMKISNKVFFQNPDDQKEFITRRFISKRKTVRLYGSGVNLVQFPQSSPQVKPITFVATGRLLIEKGFREYCKAAEIIKKTYPDTRCVLLGGYDENPACLSEYEVSGWVKNGFIEWPGWVENVEDWLKECSVFVLPSYREGTPRSILEAMAIGRAIITTDVPGCRETVKNGVNGFLVPARNASALALSMRKFIEDTSLITYMGKQSRKFAEEYYDVNKVNGVMIKEMGLLNPHPHLNLNLNLNLNISCLQL